MDTFSLIAGFLGGLGLFLLGMGLMTDGLKLAAGRALARILGEWTRTRMRALVAGVSITALVQSSSVVTVAAIGFVNAGLLSFSQSLWVLFGSNLGTTMTGWLVALVGLNLKIEAFALPMLGLGMLLKLTDAGSRRAAFGTALAGFGALFLGIDVLKDAFGEAGSALRIESFGGGAFERGTYVLAGILVTVLMQSSSAALAVTLAAVGGGALTLESAAAVAIGANVGTTVKALLAAIGATSNAKRAATAHVVFNLLAAAVALLALSPMLAIVGWIQRSLELQADPVIALALFHTAFNVLGVALMWPLSNRLEAALLARFRTAEEDEARPRYLDRNALAVPAIALAALGQELRRLGHLSLRALRMALDGAPPGRIAAQRGVVDRLGAEASAFTVQLSRAGLTGENASRLPEVLRVIRYQSAAAELATSVRPLAGELERTLDVEEPVQARALDRAARAFIDLVDPIDGPVDLAEAEKRFATFSEVYETFKRTTLATVASGRLEAEAMDEILDRASHLRRACDQSIKAARRLATLQPEALAVAEGRDPAAGRMTP
ncbi:MAG: Na/Pi cotransporter family protein [Burkholderiales bacterium]|nr:MAG: Na/Pi cotransporter family protein [Burkholderiales bacterium]